MTCLPLHTSTITGLERLDLGGQVPARRRSPARRAAGAPPKFFLQVGLWIFFFELASGFFLKLLLEIILDLPAVGRLCLKILDL